MASKMATLKKTVGKNADESLGATRSKPATSNGKVMHGASLSHTGPETPERLKGLSRMPDAAVIPLRRIFPDPDQPRKEFDAESLDGLVQSLLDRGQLQPIRVRWDEAGDRYLIICGERRYRAAKLVGLESLNCVVHAGSDRAALILLDQIAENMVRDDLAPIEQATAFRRLMEAMGWSGRKLAEELGISQPKVSRALALLNLPMEVQELVEEGRLAPSTALELAKVEDPADQVVIAGQVAESHLSREEIRGVIGSGIPSPSRSPGKSRKPDPPEWRKVPIATLPINPDLQLKIILLEDSTAGGVWKAIEDGSLVKVWGLTTTEIKLVEGAIVALRDEAGDPDPRTLATPLPEDEDEDEERTPPPSMTPEQTGLTEGRLLSLKTSLGDGGISVYKKGSRLKDMVQIQGRFYVETGGGYQGGRTTYLSLTEAVPKEDWAGEAYDTIRLTPKNGYRGLIATYKGQPYVLGGPNQELRIVFNEIDRSEETLPDGRGVPGRPSPVAPPKAKEADPASTLPPWGPAAFTEKKERVLASVEGVEIVARSGSEAYSMRVLVALNDAVARVRLDLGLSHDIAPGPKGGVR